MRPARSWAPFISIYGCYHSHYHEGGRSGHKSSGFGFVGPVFFGVSLRNHWRLETYGLCPQPLIVTPLSTTFVHILRLNHFLSTKKFQVEISVRDSRCKTRNLAVNQKDDHYGLCLEKWFAHGGNVNFSLAALPPEIAPASCDPSHSQSLLKLSS